MKRNFFNGIAGVAVALLVGSAASGQFAINNVQLSAIGSSVKSLPTTDNSMRKAARDLERGFDNVSGEIWFKNPEGYQVRFDDGAVDVVVYYDNKGKRLYTVRNYDETKLPADIRHTVRSTYYDYAIRLVQEIESALGGVTYLIHLEGKTEWINVRVANGDMDEFEKYKKSE
jgi:hypothetical protein